MLFLFGLKTNQQPLLFGTFSLQNHIFTLYYKGLKASVIYVLELSFLGSGFHYYKSYLLKIR